MLADHHITLLALICHLVSILHWHGIGQFWKHNEFWYLKVCFLLANTCAITKHSNIKIKKIQRRASHQLNKHTNITYFLNFDSCCYYFINMWYSISLPCVILWCWRWTAWNSAAGCCHWKGHNVINKYWNDTITFYSFPWMAVTFHQFMCNHSRPLTKRLPVMLYQCLYFMKVYYVATLTFCASSSLKQDRLLRTCIHCKHLWVLVCVKFSIAAEPISREKQEILCYF